MHSHNEHMIAFNNALNNEHIALKYFTMHSTMNTCSFYTFVWHHKKLRINLFVMSLVFVFEPFGFEPFCQTLDFHMDG